MKSKIFFLAFITIWLFIIIANILVPKKVFSEQENRYLSKVPDFSFKDLVSGEYAEQLDSFINDHFVGRNFWLKLNSFMQIATGKTENNEVYIGKDGFLFEKFSFKESEKENLEKIAEAVNNFSKNNNIPIYFMLVPNSVFIYQDKLPNNVSLYSQENLISKFYNSLGENIEKIDVVDILKENKNVSQLYFKTDHHITSEGSYLLYEKFCDAVNIETTSIDKFKKKTVSYNFLGTLDSKAQVYKQEPDIINVYLSEENTSVKGFYDNKEYNSIFNEKYLDKKDKYSYFLNGNNAKVVIKTNINNDRKILILKDSYAHIFAQFICQNYEEIHFIDPRYYKDSISNYINENEIDEVLFLYNVSNIVTDRALRGIK